MNVLVTGGLGQIGSHVSEMLLARGDKVVVIDNLATGQRHHLADHPNLTVMIDTIANRDTVFKLCEQHGVQAIVHTHGFWLTAQSAFGRPVRNLHNLCTYFDQRTCVSPSDDFSAIGPALKDSDIAIIIPWHGAITFGASLAAASALHVTLDYAARLDVTLPADAPQMPEHLCAEMKAVLARANYLDVTWDLIRRKGRDNFDGQRVIARPAH